MPRKPRRKATDPTPDFTATDPPIPGDQIDELYRQAGGEPSDVDPATREADDAEQDRLDADMASAATAGDLPPQQQSLTDDDGEPIAPLHDRITRYVDLRDRHGELTKHLTAAKTELIEEMKERELQTYSAQGFTVTLTTNTTVKVDSA